MTTNENELNQAAETGGLENLPENERKETQEILDEIAEGEGTKEKKPEGDDSKTPDGKPKEGDDGKKEDKEQKPEDKKPDEGKKEGDDSKGKRREAKLVPAWQVKIAEERWAKENSELKTKLEELSGKKVDGDLSTDDLKKEIEKIAEDEGLSPTLIERILQVAEKKFSSNSKLPADLIERLNNFDRQNAEREVEVETVKFSQDFDAMVLPLIKQEYGDNVPQHVIDEIKEDLKEHAYSEGFEKVPYSMLFKGDEKYRNRIGEVKPGSERSAPGTHHKAAAAVGDDVDLTKPLSEEQEKKLSEPQFETYMKNMEAYEKSGGSQ